jgi:hypothetical protein
MKKILYLLIGILCLSGISCGYKCCDVPGPMNFIRAQKNGSAWEIDNSVGRIKLDSLILADTSVNPQRTELLAFKLKFNGADTYALGPANVVYAYVPGMDNPYAYYTLDAGYANTFTVTYYNAGAGFVGGTFDIKLDKDPSNTDPRYPASVSFLSGSFSIHLSK